MRKAVSNSVHRTLLSSHTQLHWLVSIQAASFFSCWSIQSLIRGPRMYVRAVSTQSNGTFMASWVWFTSLNLRNCPQKSLALLHVPLKMVGGTPRIPPLAEGGFVGVVVVMFTDIVGCIGGSRGSEPCRDITGSRVAASASSRGPGSAISLSSTGTAVSGPHWSVWFGSDPDSDIIGDYSRGAARSVVCTWIIWVGNCVWLSGQRPRPMFGSFGSIWYEEHDLNICSVDEKCNMYQASLMNSTGTGAWFDSV